MRDLFSQPGCCVMDLVVMIETTTSIQKWVICSEVAGLELPPRGGYVREYLLKNGKFYLHFHGLFPSLCRQHSLPDGLLGLDRQVLAYLAIGDAKEVEQG